MHHTHRKNPNLVGIASEISVFTSEECEQIISLALQSQESDKSNNLTRKFAIDENKFSGLYEHIRKVFVVGNYLHFYYTNIFIEIIRYRDGDYEEAHTDWSAGKNRRKLFMTIQLSEKDDYSGCDVFLHTGADSIAITPERGIAVVWPSWTLYEVSPVTSGERWALVAWAEGNPFS